VNGYTNGDYQGSNIKHWFRYTFSFGKHSKSLVLLGAQDAGEPFFKGEKQIGYDYYSLLM